jgi:hypothetical protein
MANHHKGKVEIEIDSKKYLLSFSANALAELEIALGISMDEIGALLLDGKKVRIAHWRTMFFQALHDNHDDLDEMAARALFKQIDVADAISLVGKAYGLAFKGLAELAQAGKAASPPEAGPGEQPTGPASSTHGTTSEEAKPNSGG